MDLYPYLYTSDAERRFKVVEPQERRFRTGGYKLQERSLLLFNTVIMRTRFDYIFIKNEFRNAFLPSQRIIFPPTLKKSKNYNNLKRRFI